MNVGERSMRFVSYHMVETFGSIFSKNSVAVGLWHEVAGQIRYEVVLTQTKQQEKKGESPMSVLFPPFDPDDDTFDSFPLLKDID
jgi:hypothetical protein